MSDNEETDRFGTEVPDEYRQIDIYDGCPVCGNDGDYTWEEYPAGYYSCTECWCTWAGNPETAKIVQYHAKGRAQA